MVYARKLFLKGRIHRFKEEKKNLIKEPKMASAEHVELFKELQADEMWLSPSDEIHKFAYNQ